ncbi:MAG: transglycosylase domain-containing protein [Deltaproteobacteria bacterium]|nr:transglycosylase domain-containing protein [Deltaproteobacteria bacterium]
MHRRFRSRRLVVLGAVVIALGGALWLAPRIGRWVVTEKVLPRVSAALGRSVTARSVSVGHGRVELTDLIIAGPADPNRRPMASVPRLAAEIDLLPLVLGDVRVRRIVVDRPTIALSHSTQGNNFGDIMDRLRRRESKEHEGSKEGSRRARLGTVEVRGGSLSLADEERGVLLDIERIDGRIDPQGNASVTLSRVEVATRLGPSASIDQVRADGNVRELQATTKVSIQGGKATFWPKMSLTGISGHVRPTAQEGRAAVQFTGGYGGVEGNLWHAEGWIEPEPRNAELHLRADRFTLDKLAPILKGTPVVTPERTSIDASVDLELVGGDLSFRGGLGLTGLTVYHPWLADEPVKDLGFRGEINGGYGSKSKVFSLSGLDLEFRGVKAHLEGTASLKGARTAGGVPRARPRITGHLVVPQVSCQDVLSALPAELTPRLQGFVLQGNFAADVRVDVDWQDLDALGLEGSVGLSSCKIKEAPEDASAEVLSGEFEHHVELEQDQWLGFVVGPSNPDYVPLGEVSPHLINSFMTTEDSGFYKHHGFIVREFRSALIKNLKEGYFKYGASSITMQLVKNVLLYREKTVARKLQELVLTHYLENSLSKDRILEIYVNVIEFGPGIFGIGPAARHYFGKRPKDLNPVEAAFFSSILPNPKQRYMQYCEGGLSRWGDAKVQRIIKVMRERDRLTEEEYQLALETPLVFDRTEALPEDECKKMVRRMLQNARPTLPPTRPEKVKAK